MRSGLRRAATLLLLVGTGPGACRSVGPVPSVAPGSAEIEVFIDGELPRQLNRVIDTVVARCPADGPWTTVAGWREECITRLCALARERGGEAILVESPAELVPRAAPPASSYLDAWGAYPQPRTPAAEFEYLLEAQVLVFIR